MCRFLCATFVLLSLTSFCQGHEWTDVTGQVKADATYVSSDAKFVYVRLADSRRAHVERDRLSAGDRVYVAQLEQRAGDPLFQQTPATGTPSAPGATTPATPGMVPPATPGASLPAAATPPAATGQTTAPRYDDAPARSSEPAPGPDNAEAAADQPETVSDPSKVRFVYRAWGTAQHLAGERGTTVYYDHGDLVIAALKYKSQNAFFYFYSVDEPNCTDEEWAFAKFCWHDCGYPVWRYHNVNGQLDWERWYYAERYAGMACK
jgi:hypothetical protein